MSFYFPRQKVYITVPYKNGFTCALNFFISVENLLESKNKQIDELDSLEDIYIDHDLGVHSKIGSFSVDPYRILANKKNLEKAETRFLIIRNPYKRFSSFWHNKFVNSSNPNFERIYAELTSKYNLSEIEGIQIAVVDFLEGLAKPFTKTIMNGHLWPQVYFAQGKRYDFVINTEDLAALPKILASKSANFRAFENHTIPRLNISSNSYSPLIWNLDMKKSFNKLYSADLQFYFDFKNKKCEHPTEIEHTLQESLKKVNFYWHSLITSRSLLKKIQTRST